MTSPTQRTLSLIRSWGWDNIWKVESFNAFSGRRSDLYNIIDYLVITKYSTIGIQTCGTSFSSHINKLTVDELINTVDWLDCKNRRLVLIGWRKVLLKRGMKRMVYKPRVAWMYISGADLIVEEKG